MKIENIVKHRDWDCVEYSKEKSNKEYLPDKPDWLGPLVIPCIEGRRTTIHESPPHFLLRVVDPLTNEGRSVAYLDSLL